MLGRVTKARIASVRPAVATTSKTGSSNLHRTIDGMRAALEAAAEPIARHAGIVADAGIDGHLALMMHTDEDVIKLLGDQAPTGIGDRLRVLRALHEAAIEPLPELRKQDWQRLGEDVANTILSGEGETGPRFKILMQMEFVCLMSGLLSTVSASALLDAQCDPPGNRPDGPADDFPSSSCTPLQAADMICWAVTLSVQLLSIMLAMITVQCINILDDSKIRTWGLQNWGRMQRATSLMGVGFLLLTAGLALRVWLVASFEVASIVSSVLLAIMGGGYALFEEPMMKSCFQIALGTGPLGKCEYGLAHQIYYGDATWYLRRRFGSFGGRASESAG